MEEPEPNPYFNHILDWLEYPISFLPPFFDDPYNSGEINDHQWWDQIQFQDQDQEQLLINTTLNNNITTTTSTSATLTSHLPPDSSKKRKAPNNPVHGCISITNEGEVGKKKPRDKRRTDCNNGTNREGRWAEQLLNPCAAAITAGNLTRVQHLLYVLRELASPSGNTNQRLADHGLHALTHYISSSSSTSPIKKWPATYALTEPRLFHRSLLKFHENSPWFAFPNAVANASILQILALEPDSSRNLHILDIGVSHGLQWPTLLEALTQRFVGPPPLVRLTIISTTIDNDHNTAATFSVGPPGDDFLSPLLRFAKSIGINLQINHIENHPLHTLTPQIINIISNETLIVCTQFRLHHINPDDRTDFLSVMRQFEPKVVILNENDMDCSGNCCGDFETSFSRRVEYLWRFLDSTSLAFKGRECEERRVVEGEAATILGNRVEMNERKDRWCERMRRVGFVGEVFGEDAIDGARALLRKYDCNWEMRLDERDGCVCLWWKGQPVSFCSLWKL